MSNVTIFRYIFVILVFLLANANAFWHNILK